MIGSSIGNQRAAGSVVSYTAEYQTILDRGTALGYTLPSAAQRLKQNQLVTALKTAGIWALLDIFYVFATDGASTFATLNWKTPASFQATLVSTPTFTANQGFAGDGTSSYINTTWIPQTDAVNFTQDNAGILLGINSDLSNANYTDFGSSEAANVDRISANVENGTNLLFYRINGNNSPGTFANGTSLANYLFKRTSSTATSILKNAAAFATGASAASTGLSNRAMYIGSENINGTAGSFSARQYTHAGFGTNLAGLEAAFQTAWSTYFTSL